MSPRGLAVVLFAALAAAGCLESDLPRGTQQGGSPGASEAFDRLDAEPVGFHAWSTCGMCHGQPDDPEQRLFVAFADARAILVHYAPIFDDEAPQVVIEPNVSIHSDDLRELLDSIPVSPYGSGRAGYHVVTVETARLTNETFASLRQLLHESFVGPPHKDMDCVDCPGLGEYGRQDNGTWETMFVLDADPEDPAALPFWRLDGAFRHAEAVFDPARVSPPRPTPGEPVTPTAATPRDGMQMRAPATPECIEFSVTTAPAATQVGAGANVTATVRNVCDRDIQVQGTSGCSEDGMMAWLEWNGTRFTLTRAGAAANFLACATLMPPPVTIAPGALHAVTWRWNGTAHATDSQDVRYEPVPEGSHRIIARIVMPADLPDAQGLVHVRGA